jgi:hypothetical protein
VMQGKGPSRADRPLRRGRYTGTVESRSPR